MMMLLMMMVRVMVMMMIDRSRTEHTLCVVISHRAHALP
jgi:hypothetical protein